MTVVYDVVMFCVEAVATFPMDCFFLDGLTWPHLLMEGVKLFNKWSYQIDDKAYDESLRDYILQNDKQQVLVPHTAGRYQRKRFHKVQCPLVERLACCMMLHGRNAGKKLMAIRIIEQAFDLINLSTGENPLLIFIKAVQNSGAREDSMRIGVGGTARRQACDCSPLRRVNQALALITDGVRNAAFRSSRTIQECLSDEIVAAANNSTESYAIRKKQDLERVAKSNR